MSEQAPAAGQDQLAELQSTFAKVFGDVSLSFVLADTRSADAPMVFVSPSFCEMTGYSADELLGRNCRLLQGPATSRATVAKLRDAINESRPTSKLLLNYRKDGTPFWNALHIAPVTFNGQVQHYIGIQADVTRLVEAEAAAAGGACYIAASAANHEVDGGSAVDAKLGEEAAAAARLAARLAVAECEGCAPHLTARCAVADALPSPMLSQLSKLQEAFTLADPTLPGCPLVYASPGFLRLTGYACTEVVGRNCAFLQRPPADVSRPGLEEATAAATEANVEQLQSLRAAMRAMTAHTCLLWNFRRDGTPFLNVLLVVPLRDASGAVHYFVGVQRELRGAGATPGPITAAPDPLLLLQQKSVVGQVKVCVRSLADHGLRRDKAFQRIPSSSKDQAAAAAAVGGAGAAAAAPAAGS